ncbi:UPF0481 protein At3g47200-like [Salvia hispanica]|uniref:UPF0481 protein At3g47200-like n=1 Tax=Salvia hispanica TaxID=49212 RepID=UPI0020091632|nr:UPF0481 protein At3g47200-like [Salvia hispanica]XP_047976649.1 UPF0481 protein At3g47200-like [Salvia hispanica]
MDPDIITEAPDGINETPNEVTGAQPECTIYRVHRPLRNVNPKAYEPEVIAIGPYHRHDNNNEHLKMMEDHKLRYLKQLLAEKNPPDDVGRYVAALVGVEEKARRCYADQPKTLSTAQFIQMLVLDGCFIVQLVRKFDRVKSNFNRVNSWDRNDPIFQRDWMINSLQRDLMLFENQLPFFILCKLYDLIEAPNQHSRFLFLLHQFFSTLYPGKGCNPKSPVMPADLDKVKHLLDFIHSSWFPPLQRPGKGRVRFIIDSVTRLEEANVKFRIRSEGKTLFDVGFKEGVMTIPPLTIEDRTESFLRNLITYEQYFQHTVVTDYVHEQYFQHTVVTDYVHFLDCIIDSSMDVEKLSQKGIINNWLGDAHTVAEMVNKLGDSVAGPGDSFVYGEMFEDVQKHCAKPMNEWRASLKRTYFNSPWAVISVIVGAVLLILTAVQTVFTILQVVLKG